MKKQLLYWALVISILYGVSGCVTTEEVTIERNRFVDFSGLTKYAWFSDAPQIEGEVRSDKFSVDLRIRQAIDRELEAKGYAKTDKDMAEFFINYKLIIQTQRRVLPASESHTSIEEVDKGSLRIEVLDMRAQRPMWQGIQRGKAYRYDFIENRLRIVEDAIVNILSKFP